MMEKLLGLIHNLFTGALFIRRERVEGKIRVTGRQGKCTGIGKKMRMARQ
jgi:hypothetical protein